MHRQTERREKRLLEALPGGAASAVVAVVVGDGNRRLFEALGAERIVLGGPTMNPPTADLLAAVESIAAAEVVLLPNDANVVMAAEQAARLASRPVQVVPTESLQAGLAAAVAFNPERSAAENTAAMLDVVAAVATGEIAIASREATVDGVSIREGEYLARLNGTVVAAGRSFQGVARDLLERLLADPRDVLTLLTGEGAPRLDGLLEELAEQHPDLELDVHDGGQPHYPLLVSAE
jgi:hypothetical protein